MIIRFWQQCLFCQHPNWYRIPICWSCYQALPWQKKACACCATQLTPEEIACNFCINCLAQPADVDQSFCLFRYEPPIEDLIKRLKFHRQVGLGKLLGLLMAKKIRPGHPFTQWPEALLPVPLHSKRLRTRGYNQALLIAKSLAKQWKLPLITQGVQRQKHTEAQSLVDIQKRRINVKGSFILTTKLPYQHVAIIDDVITTGSTINELAHTLKSHGIAQVSAFAVCRTQR